MSRDDGFVIADVATGLLDDAKVKHLWRELGPDQGRMGHALALHMATLLASWREGCRVPVVDAAPVWLVVDAELVETLQRVRLLDRTGRLSVRSWNTWVGPALARKRARQEAGRIGGIASGKARFRAEDPSRDEIVPHATISSGRVGAHGTPTNRAQQPSTIIEATVEQPFDKTNPVPSRPVLTGPVPPARPRARNGDDKASPTKRTNGRLIEALDPETAKKLGLVPSTQPMRPIPDPPADAAAESWPVEPPGGAA